MGGGVPPPSADSNYDYDCSAGWTSVRQPYLVHSYRFFDHNYTKTVPLWGGSVTLPDFTT